METIPITLALHFMETAAIPAGWATCPLTENAFIRVLGRARPDGFGLTTLEARRSLQSIIANPGHQFWPDQLSLSDPSVFPHLPPARDLTGLYLLALARQRGARLATFDAGIPADLLPEGRRHLHLLAPAPH